MSLPKSSTKARICFLPSCARLRQSLAFSRFTYKIRTSLHFKNQWLNYIYYNLLTQWTNAMQRWRLHNWAWLQVWDTDSIMLFLLLSSESCKEGCMLLAHFFPPSESCCLFLFARAISASIPSRDQHAHGLQVLEKLRNRCLPICFPETSQTSFKWSFTVDFTVDTQCSPQGHND